MKILTALIVVILLMAAALANASVILSQAPVDHAPSRISDWSDERQKSDDFILTGSSQIITQIRWWGSYGDAPDPALDNFIFQFFVEDPANPGYPDIWCLGYDTPYPRSFTAASLTRTATNMASNAAGNPASYYTYHDGGTVYEYSAVLDRPVHLAAVTRYWLTITNSTPNYVYPPTTNSKWGWLESGSGSQFYRMGHCPLCADDWALSSTKNLAFALETFPQVAISSKAAADPIISAASSKFLFKLWGKPTVTGPDTFTLDDGSGQPISVESPGVTGLTGVNYVTVTGLLSPSAIGSVLKADADDIVKLQ